MPLLYFKLSYQYEWLENITTFFTTISNSNLISFLLFGDDKLDDTMKKKNVNSNYQIHYWFTETWWEAFLINCLCVTLAQPLLSVVLWFCWRFFLTFQRASFTHYFTFSLTVILNFTFPNSIRNSKIVRRQGLYCWFFKFNLKDLEWSYREHIRKAKKWWFLWGIA